MRVIEDAWHRDDLPRPTVATIGNFDGIHRGQQLVLERLRERASAAGVVAAVVTFEPHPLDILRPQRPPQRITVREQKTELLRRSGIELLTIIEFTKQFSHTPARLFVEQFLHRKLGAQEILVGRGFGFGHRREGNLALLQEMGQELGFRARGVDELNCDGATVSSTRIRQAVRGGEVEAAARLLGRPFALSGVVVRGEGRGKDHGWPTINIRPEHQLLPADGVYVSEVWRPTDGAVLGGVTNVGLRPTFANGDRRVVETHLFDFARDIYGERVELALLKRLRGEHRFPSVVELVAQIGKDAEEAREYLGRSDCSHLLPTIQRGS